MGIAFNKALRSVVMRSNDNHLMSANAFGPKGSWLPFHLLTVATVAVLLIYVTVPATLAQEPHLSITQPGGMPGWPVITDIHAAESNQVEVLWDGPSGIYRLMRKMALTDAQWQSASPLLTSRAAKVTAMYEHEFFKVVGPAPIYAGSQTCATCHEDIHNSEMDTKHAAALETLKNIGQGNNPSCLPCHTVGYGLPSGFTSESATPDLAGVQCENCHGPAALHAADPTDVTVRPRVEIAAQVCGGCHTDAHQPTFDEWATSGHAGVVEDMNGGFLERCGRCHSGSSRLAQLWGLSGTELTQKVEGDANVGITCAVCHDPHRKTANPFQLRNPVYSTNDFVLTTGADFGATYNPNINVCAQCHNHRGADWTSSSRPPHHSPQYNILLGTVGLLPEGQAIRGGGHGRLIEGQCASCHMQTSGYQSGPPVVPANTGHKFAVESYGLCEDCHSDPEGLEGFVTTLVTNRIVEIKGLLDEWGETKSPAEIRSYGALAWEYDHAGQLSNPTGSDSIRGPVSGGNADEQHYIPESIQKARFNLYLVANDGSLGVHNGPYIVDLLTAAENWVWQALNTPDQPAVVEDAP